MGRPTYKFTRVYEWWVLHLFSACAVQYSQECYLSQLVPGVDFVERTCSGLRAPLIVRLARSKHAMPWWRHTLQRGQSDGCFELDFGGLA